MPAPDDTEVPSHHKSGFVAVVGRPNVGKSTLMNAFLGQKVAIVSPRPQTTRRRQLGILTTEAYQIVFVDTPGLHQPKHKLGEYMVRAATAAVADADVILWLVDAAEPPAAEDRAIAETIRASAPGTPVLLALNKSDVLKPEHVLPHTQAFRALAPGADWLLVSAARGDNREELLARIVARLPVGPRYYPEDEITDTQLRDLAEESVREAALNHLRDEVPHGVAVRLDEFDENDPALTRIRATIFVERESHKGIVIGEKGGMLKAIGTDARRAIEALIETRVFLALRVKVRERWREDAEELRRLGYAPEKRR